MPSYRDGSTNILALSNPGGYVDQILPTSNAQGSATNIEGYVGVGSFGPVNAVVFGSSLDDLAGTLGLAEVRSHDIATHIMAGLQCGTLLGYAYVRVTDGTDTAATAALPGGTYVARYTGSRGNLILASFQNTAAAGAFAALVAFPGRTPERFDNIRQAVSGFQVVPGSGYVSVPSISLTAPGTVGGVAAKATASLVAVAIAVGSGGTGHAVGDVLTFGNGVTATVSAVNAGAVSALTLVNGGSIVSGAVPLTVGNQFSTTGVGVGARATLTWGLGPVSLGNSGFGFANAPVATVIGGGAPTPGTVTPIVSYWAALAYAINNGTSQRAKSKYVVFSANASTVAPVPGTIYTFSGGTDGDTGVTDQMLMGVDTAPRTGLYALRGSGIDGFAIVDGLDATTWPAQLAFAISETAIGAGTMPSGTSLAEAISQRLAVGVDDPNFVVLSGDWPTFYDTQNEITRLVSPTAIALGLWGNLSPEQSPINKPLGAVVATESSQSGILTSSSDESEAQNGGIDVIGMSTDLNVDYFTFLTGRNSSSNTAANGVEYTRLTNSIIRTFEKAAKAVVGKLQSTAQDDPTRLEAYTIITSVLTDMQSPSVGSGGYGQIDKFAVQCDLDNNPIALQALGYLFLFATVRYLNVVRYFVIKLDGGGNVSVSVSDTPVSVSSLTSS